MDRHTTQASVNTRGALRNKLENFITEDEQMAESSVCADCGAVCTNGIWQWIVRPPEHAARTTCAACRRIRDKDPAGVVTVQGKFSREHGDELLSLIRNIETEKKAASPLQRIMSIDKRSEKLSIATTDTQLARSIGRALRSQYKGELEFNFHKGEPVLHVLWQR